jgi:hypothetical protein
MKRQARMGMNEKGEGKKGGKEKNAPNFSFPGIERWTCFPLSYCALKIRTRFRGFPHSFALVDENCFRKQVFIVLIFRVF